MDDEIHEWVDATPESIHLVHEAATGYPFLLAKQTIDQAITEAAAQTTKKGTKMKKAEKRLLKSLNIDLSGGASTAADRLADTNNLLRQATGQTREVHNRVLSAFLAKKEADVTAAKARLAKADDEFASVRARSTLRDAYRSRLLGKMILRDNARARGALPHGRFGPNSTDLFDGSSSTLPSEDNGVQYR